MRFKGLDLNLLTAFVALVETASVTRAADRLNLSQPGMSSALKRLREYFDDEILTTHGKRMHPTAYADSLLPQIRACLEHIDSVIQTSAKFDPLTSLRTFRIAASDYITVAVVAPVVSRFAAIAPGIRIEIMLPGDGIHAQIDQGRIDLFLSPESYTAQDHPTELLFEESHVVAGWSGNPAFDAPMTEEVFLSHAHLAVGVGNTQSLSFGDRQLEGLGKSRRIEIVSPSFNLAPWLLEGTNRLCIMHERLAMSMAKTHPIRYAPMPFEFPPMREMIQYHRARQSDEGLTWLRTQLHAFADRRPAG